MTEVPSAHPMLLIVEETVQRVYRLDGNNPQHADLVNRVMQNPMEGEAHLFSYMRNTAPTLLGKRAVKGPRVPFIGVVHPKGGMTRLDPDAEHAANSAMTLLHLTPDGKPTYQIKVKRTTAERGPVKS